MFSASEIFMRMHYINLHINCLLQLLYTERFLRILVMEREIADQSISTVLLFFKHTQSTTTITVKLDSH